MDRGAAALNDRRVPVQRPPILLLAFIVFIDLCGIGLIIPVVPSLVVRLTGASLDQAAVLGGVLLLAYAAAQFAFAPLIGGLSDRYGRRPVLIWVLVALGFDYIVMAFAPSFWWLLAGRIISGVMGASFAPANSCIADAVPEGERGRAFGILGAGGAAGFVAGPAIGGLLVELDPRAPFLAAAALALAAALASMAVLRETLPPERRRAFSLTRANPFGSLIRFRASPVVRGFLLTILTVQVAAQVNIAVWPYYTALRFGWTPGAIGASVAVFGVSIALAQGLLAGWLFARFGEARAGIAVLLIGVADYTLIAFADTAIQLFVLISAGALTYIVWPAMQAMMTRVTPEDAQGELQGAITSTMAFGSIIGPPVMSGVFIAFSDKAGPMLPGAPYLLAAALLLVAAAQFMRAAGRSKPGAPSP
ncbi:MAG: tetracycline resistance MFS efflux pump [Sphingomonas sp.]|nr:tetracycline resistance MFS efflux pump [Sphingomonas sp.]